MCCTQTSACLASPSVFVNMLRLFAGTNANWETLPDVTGWPAARLTGYPGRDDLSTGSGASRYAAHFATPPAVMNKTIIFSLPALLAACASAPTEQAAQPAQATQVTAATPGADGSVCTREYRVGSTIPTTKCRTQAQIEEERKAAEMLKDSIRRTPSLPGGSGPAGL